MDAGTTANGLQQEGGPTSEAEDMQNMKSDEFDVVFRRNPQSVGQRMDTSDEGGSSTNSKRPSFPPVSAQQAEGVSVHATLLHAPTSTHTIGHSFIRRARSSEQP